MIRARAADGLNFSVTWQVILAIVVWEVYRRVCAHRHLLLKPVGVLHVGVALSASSIGSGFLCSCHSCHGVWMSPFSPQSSHPCPRLRASGQWVHAVGDGLALRTVFGAHRVVFLDPFDFVHDFVLVMGLASNHLSPSSFTLRNHAAWL